MHLTVGYLIQVVYAFRLNLIPFCFLAGGVPGTGNATIIFCFFCSFLILFFWQVAFPPEDFEEIALVKHKGGKQKDSAKKQHLNKLMGKKN
jgi:hypothetical protein